MFWYFAFYSSRNTNIQRCLYIKYKQNVHFILMPVMSNNSWHRLTFRLAPQPFNIVRKEMCKIHWHAKCYSRDPKIGGKGIEIPRNSGYYTSSYKKASKNLIEGVFSPQNKSRKSQLPNQKCLQEKVHGNQHWGSRMVKRYSKALH